MIMKRKDTKAKSLYKQYMRLVLVNSVPIVGVVCIYGFLLGVGPIIEPYLLKTSFSILQKSESIRDLLVSNLLLLLGIAGFLAICFLCNVYADPVITKIDNKTYKSIVQRVQGKFVLTTKQVYDDGEIVARLHSGSSGFSSAITLFIRLFASVIAIILLVLTSSLAMAWILLLALANAAYDVARGFIETQINRRYTKRLQEIEARQTMVLHSLFHNVDYLMVSGTYAHEVRQFQECRNESWDISKKKMRIGSVLDAIGELINNGMKIMIFGVSSMMSMVSELIGGTAAAFSVYDALISNLSMLRQQISSLPNVNVPIKRMMDVVEFNESISDTPKKRDDLLVDLTDVSVSIGDVRILKNIHLEIRNGEKIAIIGANGCGKSTLLRTILGVQPFNGKINGIFGHREEQFSYVPCDFQLFQCGLMENIAMGMDQNQPEPQVDGVFLPPGEVEGKDIRLMSQGEKQRIAILRAVNHTCSLLVADEPISSLDIRNAKMAMEILLDRNVALLVTLHDGQYLPLFERIIIIEYGRIVEDGSWEYIQTTEAFKRWNVSSPAAGGK